MRDPTGTAVRMLRRVPFLAALGDDDLTALAAECRVVSYPRNSILFHEGDPAETLLVVVRGGVKVVLQGERGQQMTLAELATGGLLGEMTLVDDAPRSATAVTLQATELLQIRRASVTRLIDRRPELARDLLRHALGRLREANETIRSLSMFDVHGRLVRCLMKLARDRAGPDGPAVAIRPTRVEIDPRPSNQRLADLIGSSRETVSRALKLLDETGFVRLDGRRLVIESRAMRRYWTGA